MGHAARANPRAFDGGTPPQTVQQARWHRFAESFATREDLDTYLDRTNLTEGERVTVDECLPARLRKPT